MPYGNLLADVVQSSTSNAPVFNNTSGTEIGKLCKAWVNYNQATATVLGSFNVSSVTSNSTGRFTVNFTTALPTAYYSWSGSTGMNQSQSNWLCIPASVEPTTAMTTTSLQVQNYYGNTLSNTSLTYNSVIVFA